MGFTQKASCRPYKNCYKTKGGASKKNEYISKKMPTRSSVKSHRKGTRKQSTKSNRRNKPRVRIFQQSLTYSSNPLPGQPYGRVVKMSYENGKSKKTELNLNRHGMPVNVKQTPVKR